MARKLRIQYPGAICHVMNRGDRREDIFVADHDRKSFVETLGATCDQTGWQVHAYCLMRVHGAIGPNDFGQERRESA